MKSIFKTLPLVVATATAAISLEAEQSPEYEEVFVTAARILQPVDETLASVEVFDAITIEKSLARDLPELLRGLAGVDVFSNGGRGANAGISLRGLASDNTLILVDGLRVSSATSGATAVQHIPLSMIERIEVVKGSKSSLYGSDALGGVIQIFTKGSLSESTPYIRVGYGSHNRYQAAAGYSYSDDANRFSANISYEDTDGFSRIDTDSGVDADDDGYDELAVSLSGSHEYANGSKVYANYLLSEGNTEFDSGGSDSTDFTNQAARIGYTAKVSESLSADFNVGFSEDDRETFSAFASTFNTERYIFNAQFDYQLSDNKIITLGYDYFDDQVESTQVFDETKRDNHALFAQYLLTASVFSVQVGVRADDNEAFGSHTTGNLALGYQLTDEVQLTFSYGTGFKSPTFNDQYFPFTDFGFGTIFQGNPNLEPEESENLEIMLRGNHGSLDWSVALYQTGLENQIDGFAFDSSNGLFTALNLDETEVEGGEISIDYSVNGWYLDLGLSYISARNALTGARLERVARTQSNLDLGKSFGAFDAAFSLYSQGNRISRGNRLGGYGLW